MSFEGGQGGSRCRGAESGDAEPPPQPPSPPPPLGEPAQVPAAPRYLPPLPAAPAAPETPERAAGPRESPGEVAPRRRGADELPPPPLPLQLAGQEVAAAGDFGEGPRRLPEAAAVKGGPGESEADVGAEGERRGAGDQPETRSVCSSRSSSSGGCDQRAGHQHHQPICKICFQGAEQGELLNPCRCDGSVRYTHQLCLLKWISERGSWTCELCCYRYHVIAIKMKQPCQWQSISITLVEKVQMIAVILGSLFLIASVTWLLWSAFSPYAVWQRKDILFQICYGMYGFMDLVCIAIIWRVPSWCLTWTAQVMNALLNLSRTGEQHPCSWNPLCIQHPPLPPQTLAGFGCFFHRWLWSALLRNSPRATQALGAVGLTQPCRVAAGSPSVLTGECGQCYLQESDFFSELPGHSQSLPFLFPLGFPVVTMTLLNLTCS
uniref:RING-type E3 ubiquitin transferase n=1 Tax=Callithrix jacchus TaxID=9483 RepID=A0A8I3X3T2_CALJA